MKSLIKKILPTFLLNYLIKYKQNYINSYSLISYSQEGEDIILHRLFEGKRDGFYVDVGAHHPKRFSNTYFFYKIGWNGINIDAMPDSMNIFNKIRPRDINIEAAISNKSQVIKYYVFNEPALNGFSKELSETREKNTNYFIVSTIEIKTLTLKNILDDYLPKNKQIDFLSIDVEGFDFQVLQSNDFEKYMPKVILVEILNTSLSNLDINNNEISNFLKKYNYFIYAKTVNTTFFIHDSFYTEIHK